MRFFFISPDLHFWSFDCSFVFQFFIFLRGLDSTNFGTKHPWVKGIQGCFFLYNEGAFPSPSGDNYEFLKIVGIQKKHLPGKLKTWVKSP